MKSGIPSEVAVVGGGPCGLFSALLLARAGVACTVFESRSAPSTHPKATGITRRTGELFRQVGLWDALVAGSHNLEGSALSLWLRSLAGEELGRVPLPPLQSPHTPCQTLHCPQPHTEAVLLEALQSESRATVHFGTRVEHIETEEGGAVVRLAGGGEHRAEWVLAADGAGSSTRKALGIDTEGPGDLGHFVNVFFRAPYGDVLKGREALLYNVFGDDFFEAFVTVDGQERWLMHHFLAPGEKAADFTREKAESAIRAASGLPDIDVEVLGGSPWVMSPKVAKSWRSGRIFLVGDAAARLSPAGGLGMNTGLQGAHNLAWKLAATIQGRADEKLLDSYEAERRPVALATMGASNKNADEIFTAVAAAMRGDWDAVRATAKASRRGGSGLGRDLGTCYLDGAFLPDGTAAQLPADLENDYHPDARPGMRAPHVALSRPGGASTLDFFGGDFVALGGRASGAWRGEGVAFFQNGIEFDSAAFEALYGIGSAGAVLVRPDGVVAARFSGAPDSAHPTLAETVERILAG